jgi:hypothetical protein
LLQQVAFIHEADLKANYAGVFLPDQLGRKYKNAAREFIGNGSLLHNR